MQDEEERRSGRLARAGAGELGPDASFGMARPTPLVAAPAERSVQRGRDIGLAMLDETQTPSSARLRALGVSPELHPDLQSDELVTMAQVITAEDGGSLRTYLGGLQHECGWFPSYKAHRLQHWEGISARNFIVECECNPRVERMQAEGIRFRFYLAPKWHTYTADMDMTVDGVRHVVEVKPRASDIGGPEYTLVLAAVAEICRRCGWVFRVVLGTEIFANRHHRDNCELFASRRFVRVSERVVDRLEGFAMRRGPDSTYGELAEVLAPGCIPLGEALIQALAIRQRVEIDLTRRVYHRAPLRIV